MDILNHILSSLSVGLDQLFPDIPIYTEVVPSRVPPRCFLIGYAGGVDIRRELLGRTKVSGKLDITYLAPPLEDNLEIKQELNRVYALLALYLTKIENDTIRLCLRKHRRQDDGSDGILHDLCDFDTFLLQIDHTPAIGTVDITEERLK